MLDWCRFFSLVNWFAARVFRLGEAKNFKVNVKLRQ